MARSRESGVLLLAAIGAAATAWVAYRACHYMLSGGSASAAASAAARAAVGAAVSAARALPGGAAAIDAQLDGALAGLRDELAPADAAAVRALPASGRRASAVIAGLRAALAAEAAADGGLAVGTSFGGLYHVMGAAGATMHALQAEVAGAFLDTNLLYPGLFRTARRVEAEAVAMAVALLRDGAPGAGGASAPTAAAGACGLLTSGGSESVLLAVKAHRDAALAAMGFGRTADGAPPVVAAARAGRTLTVVAGVTAHPALDKACELFGLRLRKLPVDARTLALPPAAVAAALDADTVLVVASAPGFAHGVVDDVAGIGAAAAGHRGSPWGAAGVPVHVDNCLGGVLLSFTPGAPPFDFRASPAVASISMDLHKYGGSPKGASVVAFREPARRRAAYSAAAGFPGGLYATPTLAGSRGGAPAALAWATLVATGADGFARAAGRVAAAHARIVRGVAAARSLALLGEPHACVVAFACAPAARASVYAVAARMKARSGWKLALLQQPRGAHVVITERFDEPWTGAGARPGWTVADQFCDDLCACAADAEAAPHDPAFADVGDAAIYGAAGVLPQGEVDEVLRRYCDVLTLVR